MARAAYRKSDGNGGRKRKNRSKEEDDDGDEEYVLGEDEVEESESDYGSDVNSRDLSDEESFEFSEFSDEDEEKEFKIERSKKTKPRTKRNRRDRKTSKVSDDEMYDLNLSVPKKRRGRPKRQKSMDSDYESDEDDEDFSPDEDDSDEDEVSIVSKRKCGAKKRRSKVSKTKGRKRQKRTTDGSDDDFIVKDKISVARKRTESKKAVGKRRTLVESEPLDLDFVTSDDDFVEKVSNRRKHIKKEKKTSKGRRKKRAPEDSGSSDSDFVVSDDVDGFDVKDQFALGRQEKNRKKVKKTAGSKRKGKKGSVDGSDSSDSDFVISHDDDEGGGDDDFGVKDQIVVYKQQMNKKKEKGNKKGKRRRNRSLVVSESSDSDYLISEEDDEFVVDEQPKKSKKFRENRAEGRIERRRLSSSVDYGSESFDFDDVISEEEVRDLGIGGGLSLEQPKKLIARKKGEVKGKEKQAEDSGTQVCGICLSEEKKSVVQGLLNCCFHYFCFACIMEWSKVESRCPVCKRRFDTITKSGTSDPGFGMRNSVIRVQKRDQVYQPSEEELRGMLDPYESVVCMECQQGGDDNLMLLCDICDSSAHTYCVGLGREVPEGNWYCECCRSVNDGLSHSQFQDAAPQRVASNGDLFPAIVEGGRFNNLRVNLNSPQTGSMSGRPSSLRIDLNSSPREFLGDDPIVSSPISGSVASTVSGRRHIRQRIHVILSNNRQRLSQMNTLHPTPTSDVSLNEDALRVSENQSSLFSNLSTGQHQQNPRPSFRSHANLVPCTSSEGSSFRHVDGAKKEVERMVKNQLKNLTRNEALERSKFKEIARTSTHAILAACGIEHHRSMVSATAVDPPDNCPHYSDDGPLHLLKGCCSSCFNSFVKDVVHRLLITETS